jgi:hypothetical protein
MNRGTGPATQRLGELAELITAGFSPYGRSPAHRGADEVRIIGTKDVQSGTLDLGHLERVAVPDAAKLAPYRVATGDVVVVIRGGAFRSAVCEEEPAGTIAGGNLAIIRLKVSGPIGPYLLHSMLSAPAGQAALRGLAQGSATLAIHPSMLAELEIAVPKLEEARRIEELCRALAVLRSATLAALRTREQVVGGIVGRYFAES